MGSSALLKQFVSFGGIGAMATLIHVAVAFTLSERLGWGAVSSNGIGATLAFLVSYFGNESFTFDSSRSRLASVWRYAAIAFLGFVTTSAIMVFVQKSAMPAYSYILLVLLIVPPITFFFAKNWAFRAEESD